MVADNEARPNGDAVPGIRHLLQDYVDRTGDSDREMSRKVDSAITHQRFNQLRIQGADRLPYDNKTIPALSRLLQLPESTIVRGYLVDAGYPLEDTSSRLARSLPPGVESLSTQDVDSIVYVTRQLVAARQTALVASEGAEVVELRPPAPDMTRVAARRGQSEGKRLRKQQDEDAEQQ